MSLDERFQAAVEVVQGLPKDGPVTTSVEDKLGFYSLYKQATVGPCEISKPSFWNVEAKYKWDSWMSLGQMTSEEAKNEYITKILKKIENVNRIFPTEEWLTGELSDTLAPKFAILGWDPRTARETKNERAQSSSETSETVIVETDQSIDQPTSTEAHSDTATSALSDAEYCDAVEDEDHLSSPSSTFEVHPPEEATTSTSRRGGGGGRASLRSSCARLEIELKNIAMQVERLTAVVESRHNLLLDAFAKSKPAQQRKPSVWPTMMFIVLWPFVAHFLAKYIGRLILRLLFFKT